MGRGDRATRRQGVTKGHRPRKCFGLRAVLCGIVLYLLASSIRCPASSIQYPVSRIHYSVSRTWVDGTHDLIARAHRIGDRATGEWAELPHSLAPSVLAPRPQVGDQRNFYAVDFARFSSPYVTIATCRAVGEFCYIFVEDEQWQRGSVTHTDVVKLERAFDESTPKDPARGIYELETTELGPAPDEIDLDPKIYILVLDIPDGYSGFGTYVAGYFEPINQKRGVFRDPNTGMKLHSNEVEMIYLDADPLDMGSVMSREILAHEFQHLIHWRHDPNEDLWINEGCSDYAALFLCGYWVDHSWHVAAFESDPQTSLVYWPGGMRSSLAHYGAAYLWMVYLHEHYGGVSTISSLIAHPSNGINGINAVLSARGYSQDFEDVFSDWKIANFLDDTTFASGKYGYRSLELRVRRGARHSSFPILDTSRSIQSWAADYIEFTVSAHNPPAGGGIIGVASDLQIDFAGRNPIYDFDVRTIAMKDGAPVAVESMRDGYITIPEFGYAVDTVILVPNWQTRRMADFAGNIYYSYSARLGEELDFHVAVLPNAVHERYVDIIVKSDEDLDVGIPRITVTRLGETLMDEQNMTSILSDVRPETSDATRQSTGSQVSLAVYVYQMYVPYGWDGSEVKWEISYLGRSVERGDLSNGYFGF